MFPLLFAQAAPAKATSLLDIIARFEFWHWVVLAAAIYFGFTALMEGVNSLAETRGDARLKRDMIARGMSADDIVRVIGTGRSGALDLPCASEVLVESEGDWHLALVLQISRDQYYIHYIGNDAESNEWVGPDRIRFPAGSPVPEMRSHWESSHHASNGVASKGPVIEEV